MSGKYKRLSWIVAMLFSTNNMDAHGADWVDIAAPVLHDPLQVEPNVLTKGNILPGDTEVHGCRIVSEVPNTPFSLFEAVDMALCNNPQIQGSWSSIKVQTALLGEARAAYLPSVNLGVSRLRQKTETASDGLTVNTERSNESKYATLTWRLLDFGGRAANHQSASALLNATLLGHDATLQRTIGKVIELYFEAQTASAYVDVRRRNEQAAQETLDISLKRERHGSGSESEVLQAKTALAKATLELSRAIGQRDKALVSLSVGIGIKPLAVNVQKPVLVDHSREEAQRLEQDLLDDWLALAEWKHPAIAAARAQSEAARERVKVVRSEGLPTLDFTQSQYLNGRPNQGLSASQTKESVLGVSVNVPLFEGFARTYKVQAAQAQVETKEAEFREVLTQVLGDVTRAYTDVLMASKNHDASNHLLAAARGATEHVRRKYNKGMADVLDMLNAQTAFADAELERVRATAEWHSARFRLFSTSGVMGTQRIVP